MYDKNKIYKITDMSRITGYDKHVLRYYEKEFNIDVPRNSAKHRYYTFKEIDLYLRIKELQETGYTNKQIKLIIESPEVLLKQSSNETAVTVANETASISQLQDLSNFIKNEIKEALLESQKHNMKTINKLNDKIEALTNEIKSKERDVLLSENAKLKMKVKSKSYEVADLREKLKRVEHKKGFLKRLFS
ncbi:MerR family transcriptional regulator [Clostridiaceae bacterium M8S5]|nr:MerR family transcriptional regulator [Clostridiaceae bacterium M8S5]